MLRQFFVYCLCGRMSYSVRGRVAIFFREGSDQDLQYRDVCVWQIEIESKKERENGLKKQSKVNMRLT